MINWKRIALFAFLFIVASALGAFPFGFIAGYLLAQGQDPPFWIKPGMTVFSMLAAMIVIARLVKLQKENIDLHAWLVGGIACLIGFIVEVYLLKINLLEYSIAAIFTAIAIYFGLLIGKRRYRNASDLPGA